MQPDRDHCGFRNDVNTFDESVLLERQRAEIERRIAEYEHDPTALLTREELWRRVDEARGKGHVDGEKR